MTYSIRSAISMAFLSTLLLAGCSSDSGDFRTAENSKFAPGKLEVPEPSGMLPEGLEAIVVPDGSPTELTAFINQVSKQVPETPEQAIQVGTAMLSAAEKMLAHADASPEDRQIAVGHKMRVLRGMAELGLPGMLEKVKAFGQELAVDDDPLLARQGKQLLFGFAINSIMTGQNQDFEGFKQMALSSLDGADDDIDTFNLIHQAALTLQSVDRSEDAGELFQKLGETFKDSEIEELAREARNILQLAEVFKADLEIKMKELELKGLVAYPPILQSVTDLLALEDPGPTIFERVRLVAEFLEIRDLTEQAKQVYMALEEAYKDNPDPNVQEVVEEMVSRSIVRLDLLGNPLEVDGINMDDGSRIDWEQYRGKVVLIDFWATWCRPCITQFTELLELHEMYYDRGFEVLAVNIDDNPGLVDAFNKRGIQEILNRETFPWTTITTSDPDARGFDTPLAIRCGVSKLPFTVLVDREGIVVATNVGGPVLKKELIRLLGKAAESSDDAPVASDSSANQLRSFMSLVPLLASRPSLLTGGILFDDEAEADKPEANPYRAAAGLSTLELVDYLLDMQEKPRTIRHRPGFAEAVSAAADRLLGAEASDKAQQIAAEVKVEILHEVASLGRKTADAELQAFVLAMKDDQREAIQQLVRFLDHEQRMLAIDDVPLDDVTGQLDSVQKYLTAEKLAARHLRLASATVHGINRLEDNEQREKYFQSFGALFAKSTDKTLSAYGRKIAKAPGTSDSKLVGNDLELSGLTELGVEIDWKAYRGKVVLVDFWATWCGPCIREMPHVRELHEKLGKQGFVVLGVNLDRKPEALAEFLKENKLPWSNLVDEGAQQAATKYGVRAIPTMMVINQQGKIAAVGHRVGGLKATIEKLLAEGKQK